MEHGGIVLNFGSELNEIHQAAAVGALLTGSDVSVSGWSATRTPCAGRTSPTSRPRPCRRIRAVPDGYAEVVPDLLVEVVSPNDTRREVAAKARMWLRYDVRLVWVVLTQTRSVDVYRPGHAVETLTDQDTLNGLDVLPGFTCPVSAIFDT